MCEAPPVSRSYWLTQTRRVCGVQPAFEAMEQITPIVNHTHPVYLFLREFSLGIPGAVQSALCCLKCRCMPPHG